MFLCICPVFIQVKNFMMEKLAGLIQACVSLPFLFVFGASDQMNM